MSRDHILHRVRTALGRGAGQAVAPIRRRRASAIPQVAMEARIVDAGARASAGGQDYRGGHAA